MQGHVMTSSVAGARVSARLVNRELIASGKAMPHMNAVGGEDRIWLGPEGGQFSIFFEPGVPFDLEHSFTPAPIDTDGYEIVDQSKNSVSFRHDFLLKNYSGTNFDLRWSAWCACWMAPRSARRRRGGLVAFESENKLTNRAAASQKKETGLLALGAQSAPIHAVGEVILPIHAGPESELGIPGWAPI